MCHAEDVEAEPVPRVSPVDAHGVGGRGVPEQVCGGSQELQDGRHADKRGYVTVCGRQYCAGPAWHDRDLLVGIRPDSVEVLADRGRHVATLPRAWGEGGPVVCSSLLIDNFGI